MFELLGDPSDVAPGNRDRAGHRDRPAKVSLERVKRREPSNIYHKMTRQELAALAPRFDWNAYFTSAGAPAFSDLNVAWPDFFKGASDLIDQKSLEDWKTYLRWRALDEASPLLPAAFVNESFAFNDKLLRRDQGAAARWKRCVDFTDNQLGRRWASATWRRPSAPRARARTSKMVAALETACATTSRPCPG